MCRSRGDGLSQRACLLRYNKEKRLPAPDTVSS